MSFLILTLVITAPGDIYRCVAEDGSVHFQGRPCEGEQIGAIRSRSAGSERRLREWLSELPPGASSRAGQAAPSAPSAATPAVNDYRAIELPSRPTDQHSLAQCSEQFLNCADGDDVTMDRCVAGIPHCTTSGGNGCCKANFIDRYQQLRENGRDRKTAVRDALLGPD